MGVARQACAGLAPLSRLAVDEAVPAQYDFGDSWYHRITLQKILPRDPAVRLPVCISGKRSCPPEDCGGIWRFYETLAILADPDHEEYEELAEWMDPDFDPESFSVGDVNETLRAMFGR